MTKRKIKISELEKFTKKYKIDPITNCYIWQGHKMKTGYGFFQFDLVRELAHRASYRIHVGEIQDSLFVLHKCDNPSCVNPEHLFTGTNQDNIDDMVSKKRHGIGEKNAMSLFKEWQIEIIREARTNGHQVRGIARYFKVHENSISNITRRLSWKHI